MYIVVYTMALDIEHSYTPGINPPRPVYAPGFTELRRFIPKRKLRWKMSVKRWLGTENI